MDVRCEGIEAAGRSSVFSHGFNPIDGFWVMGRSSIRTER